MEENIKEKRTSFMFRIVKFMIRLFYPKIELIGKEILPDEPMIIVGNHSQIHGPIACELFFPENSYTWCAGQMMSLKEVPSYAYQDFWSQKPVFSRWLYKLLAYIISPLCVLIFNNARTVPVYRDARIISTFRRSISELNIGNNIVIFPEHDKKYNNIVYDFKENFIDLARLYYKKTGKELSFVPLYIAPKLRKMYLGNPIRFNADNPIEAERERIKKYLMKEITETAIALPRHKVIPYRNIPKRLYPFNITDKEETSNAQTGRGLPPVQVQ